MESRCFFGTYARARLQSGAARQTVNNELSALRRAFNLAIDKGILATAPKIKLAKVENARDGFFEDGASWRRSGKFKPCITRR